MTKAEAIAQMELSISNHKSYRRSLCSREMDQKREIDGYLNGMECALDIVRQIEMGVAAGSQVLR